MSSDVQAKRQELKGFVFDLLRHRVNQCLEPQELCRKKAISAHSIPKSSVLNQLCDDNHVVMPITSHQSDLKPVVEFKRVGKNKASTFTGLCGKHDHEIFRPIDHIPFDTSNIQNLFLLAYRSVLNELHTLMQSGAQLQTAYQKRIELGLSSGSIPDRAGMIATHALANAFDTYEYKRCFDQAHLKGRFQDLAHDTLVFENIPPTIAASALFSLDEWEVAGQTPRVALNIFPAGTSTTIIFSYLSRDASAARSHLQRVLSARGHYQLYLVSKVVLNSCQNFAIAPSHYDRFSQEKREAIGRFFCDTLFEDKLDHEDKLLYLF